MSKYLKRIVWILLVAVAIVTLLAIWAFYPKISNLKFEYTTARVVRDLSKYIEANQGKWPKCWTDLGNGTDHSEFTRFRFDLTSEEILQNTNLIFEAVVPITQRYYTYPYAKKDLALVLEMIKKTTTESTSEK